MLQVVQRHGNGPLAPLKQVSHPMVGSGGEAVGAETPGALAKEPRGQVWEEERGSASGKQGPRHQQRPENGRRDGLAQSLRTF